MSKDPAFLFYSSDFIVGTYGMTNAQVGMYIKLMCLQHQKGPISEAMMMDITNGDEAVLQKFIKDENGCYYNVRLASEIEKRKKYVSDRLKNFGRKKTAHMKPHMETHMDAHMESHEEVTMNPHTGAHSENEDVNVNDNKNGKEMRKNAQVIDGLFNQFWSAYPKKVDKMRAAKSFAKLRPDETLLGEMLKSLEGWKATQQWTKDGGQFIPYPTTWLNGRRWEDALPAPQEPEPRERAFEMLN